jgi:dTDP-4-dehydrorhamnose reductase
LNSIWPNQLNALCKQVGARLIQISTDCVFSGRVGNYRELDDPDALDIYGRSKILGEIHDDINAITIRTSTLGHEYKSRNGLLEWFLSQRENCLGFKNAIFSGLPTVILADIIQNHVIPNPSLSGLYHIGAGPIDKFTLLDLISKKYKKDIVINPEFAFSINRSLCIDKFIADRKDLVDRLYAEANIEVKSFEDLLKLPLNEEYAKNQIKRQQASKNLNSLNNTKEDE